MSNDDDNDYEIGYGKPPKDTRFGAKNGNPRNRKGRPKLPNTLEEEIKAVFKTKVDVTVNGQKVKMSKRQILIEKIINSAINGDSKMTRLAMPLLKLADNAPELEALPEDEAVLKRFMKNLENEDKEKKDE